MTKATLIKENISLGLASSFRGLVHCNCGAEAWQHAGRQTDMVLEELRALPLDLKAARERHRETQYLRLQSPTSTVKHFFEQAHTSL